MKQREHLIEVRGRREGKKKHIRTQEDRWKGGDKVKNYKEPGKLKTKNKVLLDGRH